MSASLNQVVLHPTVTATLKYASTTVGRDKVSGHDEVEATMERVAWTLKLLICSFTLLAHALGLPCGTIPRSLSGMVRVP